MTTEYGKILLQQMEQQRRQRLQQRAEERGLPFPPDVHQRHLPDATPTRSPGWVAEASIPGGIGDEVPRDAEVKPQEGNCADSSKEGMNNRVQRNVTQEGADVARALQSLAALAPLIARQSAYVVPHSDGISTTSIPSVVPAPLIHQQPLLLQPTALLHPSLYQLGQQQLPYLYHQQATDRNFTLPIQNSDESMAREPEPFNRAALKEYKETKEPFKQATPPSGGVLLSFSDAQTGQQRLKDAKKKYQAELLKQMQERAAERELEKSRRKQEDEQERIRLSREIEQERLAKEEEDACQLIRSKHLAEANVAAARLPKQQQPHQTPSTPFDADAFSRQAPTGSNRIMRSREGIDQRPRENTISAPSETILQKDPENERRGHDVPCDRFVQQMPVGGAEAERCLLLGLEALQAEVRMQTEEMRYLKNQQRRVLQHIHQGTAFRSMCCERRCCPADAGDSCVWYPAAHPRSTAVNTKITTEQNALRDQYAFATTVLKNAGIPDPEGVMRRLAESGAIPISCGPECPGVVPVNRPSCQYNTAAPGRPDQLEEGHSTRDGQLCGVPHCSSVSMSLSRGLSNTSCCSIHTGTHDALPRAKDEYPNIKREGTQTEDPEDRPLPTLVKRLQQPVQTQQQPVSHLGAGVVHQQREQLQPQPTNNVKRPDALAEKETDTDADVDAQAKREPAGERSCREAARTKLNTSADMPVDRRWRFNELWACLSHGFPPPPALGHFIRVSDKDGEDALSESNSWCTSECESELPCQTILLQQTPDCTTPPVGKRLQQCMARQLETFSKDGWLPSSQMETLEESTAQTYMPEEQGHVSRPAQALYDGFVSVVGGGMANEAISVASETARLTSSRKTEVSLFEKSNGPQERQPLESSAAVDISGSTGIIREDQLCSTSDQQIYRALSVDAAPLKLQQLRQWDSQIRHRYTARMSVRERCVHHLQAVADQTETQGNPMQSISLPRAQERFKSRLSWEADTALPMDEGFPAKSHVRREVKAFTHPPFGPQFQVPLSPTSPEACSPSAQAKVETSNPTPAKPPSKHGLPLHQPARSSSANAVSKKSRFTRAFLEAMLPRSNSRTRQ